MGISSQGVDFGNPDDADDVVLRVAANHDQKTVVLNFEGPKETDIFDLTPDEALEMAQCLIKSARKIQNRA